MNEQNLIERIQLLEYHQKLLLKLLTQPELDFFRLVVEKGIKEQEVNRFYSRCAEMTIKLEGQKAEGFVYFYPLLSEFSSSLPRGLQMEEVILACLRQNLFEPLMLELKKYIKT